MARLERCLETRDGVCPLKRDNPDSCADECVLEGINWCPAMPHGHPPRAIAEGMTYREAEQRANVAADPDHVS
jgi:hypothetical protein